MVSATNSNLPIGASLELPSVNMFSSIRVR